MYYLDTNPAIIEDKIISFSQTLHSNHFVLLALKRRLLDLYRVLEANQKEETDPIALRKRLERQVIWVETLNLVQLYTKAPKVYTLAAETIYFFI